MADKFKNDGKKGFSGGFFFFLITLFIVIFTMQSLTSEKLAKVSFAHQVEHLVNLDLIVPEENSKIAQNENLVTFTGRFRSEKTEEGKERFDYLQKLNRHYELLAEKKILETEIPRDRKNVLSAALFFLEITGFSIPSNGFVVVSPVYDALDYNAQVVIREKPKSDVLNLKQLKARLTQMNVTQQNVAEFETDLKVLLDLFSSAKLGLGNESLKKVLQEQKEKLKNMSTEDLSVRLSVCDSILLNLDSIVKELAARESNVALRSLRSVRGYVEDLNRYNVIAEALENNEALLNKVRAKVAHISWFFNNKEISTKGLENVDSEVYRRWFAETKKEWKAFSVNQALAFKAPDQERNTVLDKTFKSQEPAPNYASYIVTFLPVLLILVVLYFLFARQMKGVGSSAMNFGKSPAKLLTKETTKVTFKDVAGAEESKEELTEIVDFLKDPGRFTALGGRIPKGVLLIGPPGTGKTLIAKAVAGEADRPFFSISGSDFVEMFVGVGASRVRDLFEQGKKSAPCIIFIDEIDAVGRQRGAGIGGGHDEREQTLNQLLVEMDGFDTKEGVILMAATNRPDILDKALLRPGRFDRNVVLDLPDVKGRFEILKVHARGIKIDPSVDLMDIAKITPGASGADLANILNEAALLAARKGRSAVTTMEAREACDKVRFGKERRSLEMDEKEKRSTAFHEAGHAMVGLHVEYADPVDKVTIIPRGFSLGATHFMPKKNRLGYWKKEVLDQLAISLGGRSAEEIFLGDLSSGAQQDIVQATKLARAMVCEWGMSEVLGTITYDEREEHGKYLGLSGFHEKNYSEETAKKIDKEVFDLINVAHKRAIQIISDHKKQLETVADMLIEFETLEGEDIKQIIAGNWNIEEKRKKLREASDFQMKNPPPPPKDNKQKKGMGNNSNDLSDPQGT